VIRRKLYRSGNSTVVAIPSYMLEQMKLKPGDVVVWTLSGVGSPHTTLGLQPYVGPGPNRVAVKSSSGRN